MTYVAFGPRAQARPLRRVVVNDEPRVTDLPHGQPMRHRQCLNTSWGASIKPREPSA